MPMFGHVVVSYMHVTVLCMNSLILEGKVFMERFVSLWRHPFWDSGT